MIKRTLLAAAGLSALLVSIACSSSSEPDEGTTTASGGSGGDGGSGGSGDGGADAGSGGDDGTGGSNEGGAGGSTGGSSGSGGAMCVGDIGEGTVADCDEMSITPTSHGGIAAANCGEAENEEPPGYSLCVRGFDIFTSGSASNLQKCLATIDEEDACATPPLQTCIDTVLADACVSVDAQISCNDIKEVCDAVEDPFDAAKCAKDMKPLSLQGMAEVGDCMNENIEVPCQPAFDNCYAATLTF